MASPNSLAAQHFTEAVAPALNPKAEESFASFLLAQLNARSPKALEPPNVNRILHEAAECLPEEEVTGSMALDSHDSSPSPNLYRQRLCIRHKRMVDGGRANMIQKCIDRLDLTEQSTVNQIWSQFASARAPLRQLILQGLLSISCQSQLSFLAEQLEAECRSDPLDIFPKEISLKIMGYLDAISLCRAAQVSKAWRALAETDTLWRDMCAQHIERKCEKCGWGLPLMQRKKRHRPVSPSGISLPASRPASPPSANDQFAGPASDTILPPLPASQIAPNAPAPQIRPADTHLYPSAPAVRLPNPLPMPPPRLGQPSATEPEAYAVIRADPSLQFRPASSISNKRSRDGQPISNSNTDDESNAAPGSSTQITAKTRPWKSVYSERLIIERNWRKGQCRVQVFSGHTEAVTCLQVEENLAQPDFPILITGSWDRTARVWNLDTGACLGVMIGHQRGIRALQFDSRKLVTGSMDQTIKIWNWRTGDCLRTLTGHTGAVTTLMAHRNLLVSGSADATIRVWNFDTGTVAPLLGHREWVDKVVIWSPEDSCKPTLEPIPFLTKEHVAESPLSPNARRLLFSSSDDATIRVWDLNTMTCLRILEGHLGQVQTLAVLTVDTSHRAEAARFPTEATGNSTDENHTIGSYDAFGNPNAPTANSHPPGFGSARDYSVGGASMTHGTPGNSNQQLEPLNLGTATPVLISGSLDNQIKFWDVERGICTKSLFGHIQGIWDLAVDKLRIASASHDRTVKLWDVETGKCLHTLVGHRGAVICCKMTDDRVISGSDDGDVRSWRFF